MQDRGRNGVNLRCVLSCSLALVWFSLATGCASVKPAFEHRAEIGQPPERVPAARLEIETGQPVRAERAQGIAPVSMQGGIQVAPQRPTFPVTTAGQLLLDEVEGEKSWYERSGVGTLWMDQRNFYTRSDYRFAAMSLGLAATFAHTDVDEDFRNWWQEDVRSNAWDDFSHFTKPLGDGYISVAIMGTGAVFGGLASETRIGALSGEWGRRSLRSIAVGTPALLFLQAATGAGRPGEWSSESDWVPFKDTNGASGHTFMGAVPFLVAAQMTDNRLLSGLWYTGSFMCGVSRINDDAHYLSQVILGWSLAQLACEAVDLTESERGDIEVVPMVGQGGTVGIGVQFRR